MEHVEQATAAPGEKRTIRLPMFPADFEPTDEELIELGRAMVEALRVPRA